MKLRLKSLQIFVIIKKESLTNIQGDTLLLVKVNKMNLTMINFINGFHQ
jgi:hypothetical protein